MVSEYTRWIHRQPCCICGRGPVDAAHVRTRGASGGEYDNLVPLCRHHHIEQHTIGIHTFQRKWQVNLRDIAVASTRHYHNPEE